MVRRGYTKEEAQAVAGNSFKATEFRQCVHPYDNSTRLDQLRSSKDNLVKLTNPHIVPDREAMAKFIGSPVSHLFSRLADYVYQSPDLTEVIKYGGKNYGWEISVKKGSRSMLSITPKQGGFTVLCVMGKKEIAAHSHNPHLFSAKANQQIHETSKLYDGKWVYYLVETEQDLSDAFFLYAIKRYGEKAAEFALPGVIQGA